MKVETPKPPDRFWHWQMINRMIKVTVGRIEKVQRNFEGEEDTEGERGVKVCSPSAGCAVKERSLYVAGCKEAIMTA